MTIDEMKARKSWLEQWVDDLEAQFFYNDPISERSRVFTVRALRYEISALYRDIISREAAASRGAQTNQCLGRFRV